MNNKSKKILKSIFANPIKANILWMDIEKLMVDLGASIHEGKGYAGVFSLTNHFNIIHFFLNA